MKYIMSLIIILIIALPASAEETNNLLQNGNGDEGVSLLDEGMVANGWSPFYITVGLDTPTQTGAQPTYHDDSLDSLSGGSEYGGKAHSGSALQIWSGPAATFAGIYQTVAVEAGTTVRFSAWSRAWSSVSETELKDEAWVRQRIGIDPTGGSDPQSDAIVWSAPAQFIEWGQLSIEVASTSENVTVFLSAYPSEDRRVNDVFYDDAELVVVEQPLPDVSTNDIAALAPQQSTTCDEVLLRGLAVGCGVAPGSQGYRSANQSLSFTE